MRHHSCRFAGTLLFCLCAIVSKCWAAEPAAVPGEPVKELPAQRIERALDTLVDVDFNQTWLSDLPKFLEKHAIKARFDTKALADAKIAPSTHLTFHIHGVSLRSALRWLLNDLDLKPVLQDDVLVITTKDVADDLTEPRVYPVLDLVTDPAVGPQEVRAYDFRRLADLLESNVRPDSWSKAGGRGSVQPISMAGALLVDQTQEAHAEITELFAMLRRVRDQQFAGGKLKPTAERSWQPSMTRATAAPAIRKALAEKKEFDLANVTLNVAIERIGKQWSIPIRLDRATDAGKTPVAFRENNGRLDTVLNNILPDLDLNWTIWNEVLLVTNRDAAINLLTIRIYPVSDLVVQPRGDEELIQSLQTLKPDSWVPIGGAASMHYFANAAALVVLQTEEVHTQLQALLTRLRQVRDQQFPGRTETALPASKDPPLYVISYAVPQLSTTMPGSGGGFFSVLDDANTPAPSPVRLAQFGGLAGSGNPTPAGTNKPEAAQPPVDFAEPLAKAIPQLIEPESWKVAGGKGVIQAAHGRLLVLQTARVHAKIARFLDELR